MCCFLDKIVCGFIGGFININGNDVESIINLYRSNNFGNRKCFARWSYNNSNSKIGISINGDYWWSGWIIIRIIDRIWFINVEENFEGRDSGI